MKRVIMLALLLVSLVVPSVMPISANALQLKNPVFYSKSVYSENQFLIKFECNAITETEKLGDYTISGTTRVNMLRESGEEKEVVVLFLIEKDSYKDDEAAFKPLYLVDINKEEKTIQSAEQKEYISSIEYKSGSDEKKIETKGELVYYVTTDLFLFQNVEIPFDDEQFEKKIRLVAYIKSEEDNLKLNKNLQITDLIINKEQGKGFYKRVEAKLKDSIDDFKKFIDKFKNNDVPDGISGK